MTFLVRNKSQWKITCTQILNILLLRSHIHHYNTVLQYCTCGFRTVSCSCYLQSFFKKVFWFRICDITQISNHDWLTNKTKSINWLTSSGYQKLDSFKILKLSFATVLMYLNNVTAVLVHVTMYVSDVTR